MNGGFTFSASDLGGSRRLALIASLVPQGGRVVDIGTDHARIPIALLERGVVSEVLATDIRSGPLFAARRHARQKNVDLERIVFLETDGFEKISLTSDDTVIISGLGGENITQILCESLVKARRARRLILQPQTYDEVLRRFLYEAELIPLDEIAVLDRRYPYLVIVCDPSISARSLPSHSLLELYFGHFFLNKAFESYRLLYDGVSFDAEQFYKSFPKYLNAYRASRTNVFHEETDDTFSCSNVAECESCLSCEPDETPHSMQTAEVIISPTRMRNAVSFSKLNPSPKTSSTRMENVLIAEGTGFEWSYLAWLFQKLQKLVKRRPFDSKIDSLIRQLELRMNEKACCESM